MIDKYPSLWQGLVSLASFLVRPVSLTSVSLVGALHGVPLAAFILCWRFCLPVSAAEYAVAQGEGSGDSIDLGTGILTPPLPLGVRSRSLTLCPWPGMKRLSFVMHTECRSRLGGLDVGGGGLGGCGDLALGLLSY